MQASYPLAIKNALAHEGGYTNHPADPGGPTNWGITIYDARKYWKTGASAADVKAMPLVVAQGIYEKRYWDAQRCDDLPAGLDYSVFDYGVNSGIGRSGKVLRRLVGLSDATSAITQEVIDAVKARDASQLILAMNAERLRFLKSLKTWDTFGKGWGRRVAEVQALSLQMAAGGRPANDNATVTATKPNDTMAKGTVKPPPVKTIAAGAAVPAGGAAAAGASWFTAHPVTSLALAVCAVFAVVAVVAHVLATHTGKTETPMPGTVAVPALATTGAT